MRVGLVLGVADPVVAERARRRTGVLSDGDMGLVLQLGECHVAVGAMIGANEFGMMKPGVILINVSRGKVVDTEASSTESSGR